MFSDYISVHNLTKLVSAYFALLCSNKKQSPMFVTLGTGYSGSYNSLEISKFLFEILLSFNCNKPKIYKLEKILLP